ncbi:spore coat U domain-containing protein [Serratia ureilytica]
MARTAGAFISYNLYQDARTPPHWGSGANALTAPAPAPPFPLIVLMAACRRPVLPSGGHL